MKKLKEAISNARKINEIENSDKIRATVKKRRDIADKAIDGLTRPQAIFMRWAKDKSMADFKPEIQNAIKALASGIRELDRLAGTMDDKLKKMFQNKDVTRIP